MVEINPQRLFGNWKEGWALDLHTLSSTLIEPNKFDTLRTPIGEELYRLKYWNEQYRVENIAKTAANFLNKYKYKWLLDVIIPVPPSDTTRIFQPVFEITKSVGRHLRIPVQFNLLRKIKPTSQIKDIDDPDIRMEILEGAFDINFNSLEGMNVLIFDDLYRSGTTLNAICSIISDKANASDVYVLTITKTRSKR